MNDDQFEALDDRAKTAASSVQAAAQRRARPAFDADRPMTLPQPAAVGQARAPRRTAWVAAAAMVALVAGAVTFAATRPDDGKDTVAATAVEDPQPYLVDDLPDGMKPMAFMELKGAPGQEPVSSAMPVFGRAPEDPLAAALVVDAQAFSDLELVATEVDGVTLYRSGDATFLPGQWVGVKKDEAFILVAGATEDDATALARIVSVVDGSVSVDVEQLPEGWRRLTTVADPSELLYMAVRSTLSGYMAAYVTENAETSIQVVSAPGNEPSMWAGRLFVADSREVSVRGHRGYIGSFPLSDMNAEGTASTPLTMRTMAWVERPGEVIRMTGISVSEDELLAAAESIRPAAEQEWADLVDKSQLGELGDFGGDRGSDAEVGRSTGTFGDGTKWSVSVLQQVPEQGLPEGVTTEGGVYTELRVVVASDDSSGSQGSSSSMSGGKGGFASVDTTDIGGRHFASGVLTDETQLVQVLAADGSVSSNAWIEPVGDYRVFLTELTEDPTVIVALRADGSEIDRITFDELDGNVTVDRDGNRTSGSTRFEGQGTAIDENGNPIIEPAQPSPTSVVGGD